MVSSFLSSSERIDGLLMITKIMMPANAKDNVNTAITTVWFHFSSSVTLSSELLTTFPIGINNAIIIKKIIGITNFYGSVSDSSINPSKSN